MSAHLTPEQVELIIRLRAKKVPLQVIADMVGKHVATVKRALKRHQNGS
jgi:IS30 family transposase